MLLSSWKRERNGLRRKITRTCKTPGRHCLFSPASQLCRRSSRISKENYSFQFVPKAYWLAGKFVSCIYCVYFVFKTPFFALCPFLLLPLTIIKFSFSVIFILFHLSLFHFHFKRFLRIFSVFFVQKHLFLLTK